MEPFGYFVPEFPGQTHTFFWRELKELKRLGFCPEVVSTRRPKRNGNIHTWADDAKQQTYYLMPATPWSLCRASWTVLMALARGGHGSIVADIVPEFRRVRSEGGLVKSLIHLVRLLLLLISAGLLLDRARTRGWKHVHVHFCSSAAQIALFAHLLDGLPYSMTLHGSLDDYGPNQPQKWRHAAFAIVITQTLLETIRSSLAGCLPPVVEVSPMGVDVAVFKRQSNFEAWDGSGPVRLFSCGRLNPSKGHDDVIDGLQRLLQAGIDANLTIAGEDDAGGAGYRLVLQQQILRLGLARRVRLIGAVSEERIRQELESAHVFVLASHAEAFGIATAEAMALTVPVVVTGTGGVKELVDDGLTGILVPACDPQSLADALMRVLGSPALAADLARAARKSVEENFDSSRSALLLARLMAGRNFPS